MKPQPNKKYQINYQSPNPKQSASYVGEGVCIRYDGAGLYIFEIPLNEKVEIAFFEECDIVKEIEYEN